MINVNWQPGITLEELEKQAILQAMGFYKGNKTQTARALDIAVRTLDLKLEKYGQDEVTTKRAEAKRQFDGENFLRRQRGLQPLESPFEEHEAERVAEQKRDDERVAQRADMRLQERGIKPRDPSAFKRATKNPSQDSEESSSDREKAGSGVHVQSTSQLGSKHSVSMPVGKEVQEMPSRHVTGASHAKRR